jgi:hypothetical protein
VKNKTRFGGIDFKLAAILILASYLRFYDYSNRWGLAYDQAWFAIIARHAINTFQLPLLGPFASGGPFQTGGEWFWIVMLGTVWAPNLVIAPWIFITLLSVFQVYLMYVLGKAILNYKFGLLTAFLTAVSTSQTLQATNLTNQMVISIFSTFLIWSIVKYLKKPKNVYLFLIGLSVGIASAIHLQGIMLLPVVLVFLIFARIFDIRKIVIILLGILTPWLPVLYVDVQNGFYNTRSMLNYPFQAQGQVSYDVLGRRWLTFVLNYVPSSWARIVGGNIFAGFGEILILTISAVVAFKKRLISKEWYIIGISTVIMTILLRYIRTPLYENYINFLHPFVILLIAWAIYRVYKFKKILAVIAVLLMLIFSILATTREIKNSTNLTAIQSQKLATILIKKYPNEKFSLYDYDYKTGEQSLPIVMYLYSKGRISENGRKIGYTVKVPKTAINLINYPVIYGEQWSAQYLDLTKFTDKELLKTKWKKITPKEIYDSVQFWYLKK